MLGISIKPKKLKRMVCKNKNYDSSLNDKECLLFFALVPSLNFPICKYRLKIKEKKLREGLLV